MLGSIIICDEGHEDGRQHDAYVAPIQIKESQALFHGAHRDQLLAQGHVRVETLIWREGHLWGGDS